MVAPHISHLHMATSLLNQVNHVHNCLNLTSVIWPQLLYIFLVLFSLPGAKRHSTISTFKLILSCSWLQLYVVVYMTSLCNWFTMVSLLLFEAIGTHFTWIETRWKLMIFVNANNGLIIGLTLCYPEAFPWLQ